jgi:hypothetical protein
LLFPLDDDSPHQPHEKFQNERRWDIPDQFRSLFPGSEEVGGALAPYLVDYRSRVIQLAEMGMGDIRGTPECVVVLRVMKVAVARDWENSASGAVFGQTDYIEG